MPSVGPSWGRGFDDENFNPKGSNKVGRKSKGGQNKISDFILDHVVQPYNKVTAASHGNSGTRANIYNSGRGFLLTEQPHKSVNDGGVPGRNP